MGRLNKKTSRNPHTAHHESPDIINLSKVLAGRYQDLFNNASDAIFIRDLKGNITEVNKAAATLTGYTHNELTGMNASEFLTAESFKLIMKKQKALLKDETANRRYELEIIRKDGVRMNAESRTNLLTHKGWPLGVQCIVRDITERERAEEALRESEERYRTVADFTYDWEYWIGPDGDLRYISPSCERMTGYRVDEFLRDQKLLDRIIHPDDYPVIARHINAELKSEEAFHADFRIISRSGEERWISHWCQPVYGNDGSWLGRRVSNRDITERKRVEEALQASEERFRNIYEESPIGIELYDCDGRLLTVNRACLDIFGVSNIAEVRGFKLFEDPNVTDEVKQRLHKGKTVRYEALFDFEKVKKHKLYDTSKSGAIHLNVLITPLGVRGGNSLGGYLVQAQDITKRKQAEEALRESEQNFRNSLDDSPLGIRIVTAEGELFYANQAILDIYGYSSVEELKAVPTKQRYTPESYAEYQERKAKRKQGEPVPADYEISIVRKDGEVRYLAVFREEVIWGGEVQFQTLYQDITEHKQTAEELRRFKAISDRAGYGAGIITPDGNLIYVNESFAGMHGYTIGELIGKHLSIFHTREQMKLVERLNKKLIQKGSYAAEEVWHKKKNGMVFPTLMTGTALTDDMGKSLYLSATAIDITERKRVEMALRQSEEFNSSLLANSPSPILVLNADASIRYVNPALEKLTGFSSAELVGSKPPYPWWIEENRKELNRRLVQAMHRGAKKYEFLFRKKNGEQFWVEKIFKTVRVNGEFKYHLVEWVDLTEQKRLRANMEFYLAEITKAQEAERRRIAREIHDESIQSLATLALGIDAIARGKEKLSKDVMRRLKGLRTEVNSILDGLRCFSHELRPGVIDQVGLVAALEILTEELNKENRVKTSLEVAGSERRLTPETELALFRIAQEALRNVKKHSTATKTALRLKFTRSKIKLTVSDNGRGFELPDILSDFAAEGKLGLIGMQERTRLLGGKLLVRSWVGRGTTVVVEVANIG